MIDDPKNKLEIDNTNNSNDLSKFSYSSDSSDLSTSSFGIGSNNNTLEDTIVGEFIEVWYMIPEERSKSKESFKEIKDIEKEEGSEEEEALYKKNQKNMVPSPK